jgi:hypothetical protein
MALVSFAAPSPVAPLLIAGGVVLGLVWLSGSGR